MEKNIILREYASLIFTFRGRKVMLDSHLSSLYGVETRTLKQTVRRNNDRFPEDFMFELTRDEMTFLIDHGVYPSHRETGGSKPMVFTEQGVAMLSSVLRSEKAIQINIEIMRAFSQYRAVLLENEALKVEIKELDKKIGDIFKYLLERLDEMHPEITERDRIGFK